MTLRVTVAESLTQLGDVLAAELAEPLFDPFTPEVVAVPSDGVRAWCVDHLASRLGATGGGDGVVANVEWLYPARLVRRALGEPGEGRWEVGPLTWAVYDLARHTDIGLGATVDMARARAVADLFDRYTVHRPWMARRWEAGDDVDALGATLPGHLVWQPRLWRMLCTRFGSPSDAARMAAVPHELRGALRTPALPGRVFLFGLTSFPLPHLAVLAALAAQVDVHVLAPVTSLAVWQRVMASAAARLPFPIARAEDPSRDAARHPLTRSWGGAAREAHLLLAAAALEVGATAVALPAVGGPAVTALATLQAALRDDSPPPGSPGDGDEAADGRAVLDPHDRSIEWHRCHGLSRQVEVLRDVVVQLLDERAPDGRPAYAPRDVLVLCPDPGAIAAQVEAVFAGNPAGGVPAVPVRVADRSVRTDVALLAAVAALLALGEGRYRASDVLAFAALAPVARRFGLSADHLGTIAEWVEATNVHWGLHQESRGAYGLADLEVSTWRAGLDQVLMGVAMSPGPDRVGPGGVVPLTRLDTGEVELAGVLGDLLDTLDAARCSLGADGTAAEWCASVRAAASSLCALADDDAWQWTLLDELLDRMVADADAAGAAGTVVPAAELAGALAPHLAGRPRRPPLRGGEVTVSSLVSHRGVPAPVVCVLGLDDDPGTGVSADDLIAAQALVGDRDARIERRAQLLDAVLAAQHRLVVLSTGRDVRSNAPVEPPVVLAELADVLNATFRAHDASGTAVAASEVMAIEHPRHAWSNANFEPGRLLAGRSWSVDQGACAGAQARRQQSGDMGPVPGLLGGPEGLPDPGFGIDVPVADLELALRNPVRLLLQRRLGLQLPDGAGGVDDLIPLRLDGLSTWRLADDLLTALCRAGLTPGDPEVQHLVDEWRDVHRARGDAPPLDFGGRALDEAQGRAEKLYAEYLQRCAELAGGDGTVPPGTELVRVEAGGRAVVGELTGSLPGGCVEVTASSFKEEHRLVVWLRAALLTAARGTPCTAVLVARRGDDCAVVQATCASVDVSHRALMLALDLHDAARSSLLPALPELTRPLARGDEHTAHAKWDDSEFGTRTDRWVSFALGHAEFDDLLAEPFVDGERPWEWPHVVPGETSRLRAWSQRLWGEVRATGEPIARWRAKTGWRTIE